MEATYTQQRPYSNVIENCLNHSQDRSKQTSKLRKNLYGFCTLDKSQFTYLDPTEIWNIYWPGIQKADLSIKCDRACENRACGLNYVMLFDSKYLNTEM